MGDRKRKLKPVLFLIILILMVLPILYNLFNINKIDKLNGAIVQLEKPLFSFDDWFSGEYQEKEEKFINENFGFRNLFIRLNNQIYFDFYKKAKANGVIIGKQNYLFEENYIKAFYGTDFIGKDSINKRMEKFKYLQDTLQKLNKNLLLIFAAGKGTYYSEYIPEKYKVKKSITNYGYHLKIAKKLGVNYIDFNQYFLKNKYKSKYPLYPKYGIHWSIYGMCLAADSIIKHIEKDRKIDMNSIYWEKVDVEDPKNEDYDIGSGMNLLFKLKSFKMGYPQIKFEKDNSKIKPNLLVVSDSYYWGMFNFGISTVFNESHFWYYNKEIYPDTYTKPIMTDQIDLRKEINKHDVIIVMSTQATMTDLGWGFIEKAYDLYKK